MAKQTPLDYTALNEQLSAMVDEFSALRKDITRHLAPQPELKLLRKGMDEWTGELLEDLTTLQGRVAECAIFAPEPEPAASEDDKAAVEKAIAEATEGEGGESTEGETTEPAAKPAAKSSGRGRRQAVPA